MASHPIVSGFSKLSGDEKIRWLASQTRDARETEQLLRSHHHTNPLLQGMYEEFSENTVSNFFLPYGLAPNFLINDHLFIVPMVIEESSVVAAASHAARFWAMHGGFHAKVIDRVKTGQVHFKWSGDPGILKEIFRKSKKDLITSVSYLTERMEKRGGGIRDLKLVDKTDRMAQYHQLFVSFCTADAMGANFINSVLEALSKSWQEAVQAYVKKS